MSTVTPAIATSMICLAYEEREPLFIWGPPGIGKSEIVAQATRKLGIDLIDFRLALADPTELKGFPMPEAKDKTMIYYRDSKLPMKGKGTLLMDEMNSAPQATQAAGMQLTLKDHQGKHRLGDYELPAGWGIIGAGNREGDRGVVHRMPSPLANRFTHIELEPSVKDWTIWALANGISAELVAFIRFKEDLLFKFDPKVDSKAFPTPRAWVRTEKWIKSSADDAVKYAAVKGTVGDGPGQEYWGFLSMINELPDINDIRKDPKHAKLPSPEKPGTRYAITTMLGAQVANEKDFEAFLLYTERLDKEFQCVFVRDALRKLPKLETSKAYAKWGMANADFIV